MAAGFAAAGAAPIFKRSADLTSSRNKSNSLPVLSLTRNKPLSNFLTTSNSAAAPPSKLGILIFSPSTKRTLSVTST